MNAPKYAIIPDDSIISPVIDFNASLNSFAFFPQLIFSPPNPYINYVALSNYFAHLSTLASKSSFSFLAELYSSSSFYNKSKTKLN
jgi:hypothetical protein